MIGLFNVLWSYCSKNTQNFVVVMTLLLLCCKCPVMPLQNSRINLAYMTLYSKKIKSNTRDTSSTTALKSSVTSYLFFRFVLLESIFGPCSRFVETWLRPLVTPPEWLREMS